MTNKKLSGRQSDKVEKEFSPLTEESLRAHEQARTAHKQARTDEGSVDLSVSGLSGTPMVRTDGARSSHGSFQSEDEFLPTQNDLNQNDHLIQNDHLSVEVFSPPPHFYLEEVGSKLHYTRIPTHGLSPERLIRGQPCYPEIGLNEKKQKTLILNDWRICYWADEKFNDFSFKLEGMLNQGFKIYLPMSDKTFSKLTPENIYDNSKDGLQFFRKKRNKLLGTEMLPEKLAKAEEISLDNTYLLDERDVDAIQTGEYQETRRINLEDILKERAYFGSVDSLTKYLNSSSISIPTEYIYDHISTEETLDLCGINIGEDNLYNLLANASSLKTLRLDQKFIGTNLTNDLKLGSLESLEVRGLTLNELVTLVGTLPKSTASNLKSLTVIDCAYQEEFNYLDFMDNNPGDLLSRLLLPNRAEIENSLALSRRFQSTRSKYSVYTNQANVDTNQVNVDAEIDNQHKTFNLKRYFFSKDNINNPSPSEYRCCSYANVEVNPESCSMKQPFKLYNSESDSNLTACDIVFSDTDVFKNIDHETDTQSAYYGKYKLDLGSQWKPLPSLSPNEKIIHLHSTNNSNLEIKYSQQDNFYYVKSKNNNQCSIEIDYTLTFPKAIKGSLPEAIVEEQKNFLAFQSKPLELPSGPLTGKDYLSAILEQKTGSCRHRAVVFHHKMKMDHPGTPCRTIFNDCHAFVEIQYEGSWHCVDLGGTEGTLEIDERYAPETMPSLTNEQTDDDMTSVDLGSIEGTSDIDDRYAPKTIPSLTNELTDDDLEKTQTTQETLTSDVAPHLDFIKEAFKTSASNNDGNICLLMKALNAQGTNQLIDTSKKTLERVMLYAQNLARNTKKPCFRINTPDDIVCSSRYVKQEGNKGIITEGPGGKLHDFLTEQQDSQQAPILLVNYANFSASDIVRLNQLIDETRRADGTPVPKNATIIGFIDSHQPNTYKGADFYSRFDNQVTLTDSNDIKPILDEIPSIEEEESGYRIPLFNSASWEALLIGQWQLKDNVLTRTPGALVQAIRQGKQHYIIENPPIGNPSFNVFLDQARLLKGFYFGDEWLDLPAEFKLSFDHHEHLSNYKNNIEFKAKHTVGDFILSAHTLAQCFSQYTCNNNLKTLSMSPGIIESSSQSTLSLHLTFEPSEQQWTELLAKAKSHNVHLLVSAAPNIKVPKALGDLPLLDEGAILVNPEDLKKTALFISNNPEKTLESLPHDDNTLMINVTDVEPSQLLTKLSGAYNSDTHAFEFQEESGVVVNALNQGKNVILTGVYSNAIQHALAPYVFERIHQAEPKGALFLLPDNPQSCLWCPQTHQGKRTEEEYNYYKQAALARYKQAFPDREQHDPWVGLEFLSKDDVMVGDINLDNSEQQTKDFFEEREAHTKALLEVGPFVFLAGLTGVGKSTFVLQEWRKNNPHCYVGLETIKQWAISTEEEGIITLFIDEANLSPGEYTNFEGLFRKPPGILIDNIYYPLSDKHKVIFAGNPVSYGDERHLGQFFINHGQSLLFKPLPPAVLYEQVIKPLWQECDWDEEIKRTMAHAFLKVQKFVNETAEKILISPRELCSMALFTQNYLREYPSTNPEEVAKYYAHKIAISTLFDPTLKKNFLEQFGEPKPLSRQGITKSTKPEFTYTPSRQALVHSIDDFLVLRKQRQESSSLKLSAGTGDALPDTHEQLYRGLGGLVVEGEPGIGKSVIVLDYLAKQGFSQANDKQDNHNKSVFYHIPASMGYEKKHNLLLKAFDEGAIVIIDEINTTPMMENLLNGLLTGYDPDGNRPKNPGFLLVGTQNPAFMAGRRMASTALQRRLMKFDLPPYNTEEMQKILKDMDIDIRDATALINRYHEQKKVESSTLCFRDLIKCAKQLASANDRTYVAKEIKQDTMHKDIHKTVDHDSQRMQAFKNAKIQYTNMVNQLKSEGSKEHVDDPNRHMDAAETFNRPK